MGAQPPIVEVTNPPRVYLSGGVAGGVATPSTRTLLMPPSGTMAEPSLPLTLQTNTTPLPQSGLATLLASNPMIGSNGDPLPQGLTTEVEGVTLLADEEGLLKTIGLSTPRTSDLFTLQTPPLAAERVALATSSTTPSITVHTPLQQPGWSDELGGQVTWMVKQNLHAAEIKLNPAQLGPIEVKITMHQDQATITLAAAHGVTRDALEAALPRLREMFADAGVNVANANVSSQTPQGGQGGREQPGRENPNAAIVSQTVPDDGVEEGVVTHITTTGALGGLDLFA